MDVLQNEEFMKKYYDSAFVPKESELSTDEFRTRLESGYACLGVFKVGHRIRCSME